MSTVLVSFPDSPVLDLFRSSSLLFSNLKVHYIPICWLHFKNINFLKALSFKSAVRAENLTTLLQYAGMVLGLGISKWPDMSPH